MAKILWRPLTFGNEEQIAFIQREEEKNNKYNKLSVKELKAKIEELDLEIGDLWLDIHYHETQINDLEIQKEEKEEELEYIKKILEQREYQIII